MGGGGGGSKQSTTTSKTTLPGWEQPVAKEYLASLLGYVFPGSTVPASWFNTKGMSFPTGGVSDATSGQPAGQQPAASGGPTQGTSPAQQQMAQLDPSGTAYGMFAPLLSGSPFLQNMMSMNPGAVTGAISPMAAAQMNNPLIYGRTG